jgi:sugar lactone lactonase YvrE
MALLAFFLSACDGRDVTSAIGTADPFEVRPAPPASVGVESPAPDTSAPSAEPSELPAADPADEASVERDAEEQPTTLEPAPSEVGVTPAPEQEVVPVDCSRATPAPASYELLEGFSSSEDFVFDEIGNYVGIDDDNNLVRVSRDRERWLWAPKIGSAAGMGSLPDGSVVFCEVEEGAIKRVYPNGAVEVVLGGLLYPNGLDIGPDGFVYVAENNAGRVRRINPDSGEFSIVAMGLQGPNGVAFSNDPKLLYVGSFEGSGVYKVEIPAPGELGHASVFARPPGSSLLDPVLACPDQLEGVDCVSTVYTTAKCQALANVIDCLPVDPCPGLPEQEYCDYPALGTCQSGRCEPILDCEELGVGAACEIPYYGAGVCEAFEDYAYCTPPNTCEGLSEGADCEDPFFGSGICRGYGGDPYCTQPNPCDGQREGAACEDPNFGAGVCQVFEDYGYCVPPNPCDGLRAGAACEDPWTGVGVCQSSDGYVYCGPPSPCDGLAEGASCVDGSNVAGVCIDYDGQLYCAPPNVCQELLEGETCYDPLVGTGTCTYGVCGNGGTYGSGIDGLGVDACGNVYASEYISGKVWRISPAGEIELLAELPSSWIPNIKWGRDVGGFSSDVMYVADREKKRLFGIYVGIPGATEFFAMGR